MPHSRHRRLAGPVIALRAGGALETIKDGETGIFFPEPTVDSLIAALNSFTDGFDPAALRRHAVSFDRGAFKDRMFAILSRRYDEHVNSMNCLSSEA